MVKPLVQALLLAERVYQDSATHTKIICGVFNSITVRPNRVAIEPKSRPEAVGIEPQMGPPTAYINLTEVHGTVRLELRYVDLQTHEVLLREQIAVTSGDPLQNVEVVAQLPILPVHQPGQYALEVLYEDEILNSVRINVDIL